MLRSNSKHDRGLFRAALVKIILDSEPVKKLRSEDQGDLFLQLSAISPSTWEELPHDTTRIRSLNAVASNSRRLKQAVAQLGEEDSAILDDAYQHSTPLASILTTLEKLAEDANKLEAQLRGKQRDRERFRQGHLGADLLKVLKSFEIPCSTRNDYDKRHIANESRKANASNRRRDYTFLPSLEGNATPAMRCAMLVLFDANARELDWSTTVALIKAGKQFLDAWAVVQHYVSETSFGLRRAFMDAQPFLEKELTRADQIAGPFNHTKPHLRRNH